LKTGKVLQKIEGIEDKHDGMQEAVIIPLPVHPELCKREQKKLFFLPGDAFTSCENV